MATPVPVLVPSRQRYVNPDGTPTREFYIFLTNLLAEVQGGAVTLGTAAFENIGTSGGTVPLLNAANVWSALQTFDNGDLALAGGTSGHTVLEATGVAGGVITFPNATDTVVLLAATQTITNKTIQSTANTMDVAQIAGTVTNDVASAGNLGEFLTASITSGAVGVSVTTLGIATVTSISLPAGDWDVWGTVGFSPASVTSISRLRGVIDISAGTIPAAPNLGAYANFGLPFTASIQTNFPVGMRRLSSNGTNTAFLNADCNFSGGTMTVYGFLGARRRR